MKQINKKAHLLFIVGECVKYVYMIFIVRREKSRDKAAWPINVENSCQYKVHDIIIHI